MLIDLFGSSYNTNGIDILNNIPSNITVFVGAGRLKLLKLSNQNAFIGWDHSKLIVVDGEEMITGGMNFIQMSLNGADEAEGETTEDTVHDLLVRVQGEAARNAQLFINAHWERLKVESIVKSSDTKILQNNKNNIIGDYYIPSQTDPNISNSNYFTILASKHSSNTPSKAFNGFDSLNTTRNLGSKIKIITVGRRSGYDYNKEPSDIALIELIKSAKNTLYISQQALFYPTHTTENCWMEILKSICEALYRHVEVKILLSRFNEKNVGADGGYSSEKSHVVIENILSLDNFPELFDENLLDVNLLTVRNLKTENGYSARNHAKVIISDEKTAYVGSQNLYPNIINVTPIHTVEAKLGEFGLIIFNENKVKELVRDYWNPLWNNTDKLRVK